MKKLLDCRYFVALFLFSHLAGGESPGPTSKILQQDKFALKQMVAPAFQHLPLDRRILVSYLSEAIEAGRDIAWVQQGSYGLAIRNIFETIFKNPEKLTKHERGKLEHYYFRLLQAHGVYDRQANEKFVLEGLTPASFAAVLQRYKFPLQPPHIWQAIFEKDFHRYAIAPRGGDLIKDSGVNFYGPGLTIERLNALDIVEQKHFLSYPQWDSVRQKPVLTLHRLGDRFGTQLEKIDRALEKAEAYANNYEKKILAAYRKVIRTGSPEDQLEADRIWVQNQTKDIIFHIGFTETYDDPLQYRGTWQGFIMLLSKDEETERRSNQIRAAAVDFESRMPVDDEFKKKGEFTPPVSESAHLVYMGGDNNETFFSGVNLPNDSAIRASLGSKSLTATNKIFDVGQAPGEDFIPGELQAFYQQPYHNLMKRFGQSLPYLIETEFHEILGHGSGRDGDGVDSKAALSSYYAAMEEGRAELAALYHLTDIEALVKHKIFPADWDEEKIREFAKVSLLQFFTKHILSLEKLKTAKEIRQAHQLGRHMIFNDMISRGALTVRLSEAGVPQIELPELSAARQALGEIWRVVQRMKGAGDNKAMAEYTAAMGVLSDEQRAWIPAISEAFAKLKRPDYTIYIAPRVRRVTNTNGEIVDVVQDFIEPGGDLGKLFAHEQKRACENLVL